MNENQWDEKLRTFLKKTGEDLKRAGHDIRQEAEKLMKEVQDPDRQEKVKKGLETFKGWARKTAEEVASVVETGMKKAEVAVRATVDVAQGKPDASGAPAAAPTPSPSAAPVAEPLRHDTPVDTPAAPAPKSMGGSKKKAPARKPAAKKPLGKKQTP